MGVLIRGVAIAGAIAGGGCYAPELQDCTVACADGDACADGQVCGADGWCAAPEVAGTCDDGRRRRDAALVDAAPVDGPDGAVADAGIDAPAVDAGVDAGVDAPIDAGIDARIDAGVPDAPPPDAPPDAAVPDAGPAIATLRIVVVGRGRVVADVPGVSCDGQPQQPGDCTFPVAAGEPITLLAVETHHHWELDRWTAGCGGSSASCTVTVHAPSTLVGARFEEDD